MPPTHLVILDIDGLRRDVFHHALQMGTAPNLSRLLGGRAGDTGLHLEPVSNAPSITFCCQSSIFTGAHPEQHGIMGNQFFDRFGRLQRGGPQHYAFDVGDALAVDDAVRVFMGERGLVGELIPAAVPTIYERVAAKGLTSVVAYNMIGRGATTWLRPSLVDIARFTKGGGLLGLSSAHYDTQMLNALIGHLQHLPTPQRPAVITAYFMGLDHHSHEHGPAHQLEYLTRVVDGQVGRLITELERLGIFQETLFAILSDHGQIGVIPDDQHSLRLSFPFDREMGHLFDALGLDVQDVPGEGPNCDAVVACNGGLAHIYLRRRAGGQWADQPRFGEEVVPVAQAFWEAHRTGHYATDLQGALGAVLVRNVERDGWEADYQALTPAGEIISVEAYFAAHPEFPTVEAALRLKHLASPFSGDLILLSNYPQGFYFATPLSGVHGGLHPEDSEAVLAFGFPGGTVPQIATLREQISATITARCQTEGGRRTGVVDMMPAACAVLGW